MLCGPYLVIFCGQYLLEPTAPTLVPIWGPFGPHGDQNDFFLLGELRYYGSSIADFSCYESYCITVHQSQIFPATRATVLRFINRRFFLLREIPYYGSSFADFYATVLRFIHRRFSCYESYGITVHHSQIFRLWEIRYYGSSIADFYATIAPVLRFINRRFSLLRELLYYGSSIADF